MCSRHYRCAPELTARYKRVRAVERRICRLLNKRWAKGTISADAAEAIYQRIHRRSEAIWTAIKAEAQRLQDMGYWTRPKGSRRRGKAPPSKNEGEKLNTGFEAAFQRLKRGVSGG